MYVHNGMLYQDLTALLCKENVILELLTRNHVMKYEKWSFNAGNSQPLFPCMGWSDPLKLPPALAY